ncbi:Ribosomal RNA small subunit methyltransferase E [Buchnera aphidicola (Cinara pseudotaxifoliae)]|uniref:Ribosomal RNA small subunit methyltransferase E n=1 Tax=Buchnera aphidicola (Cinara pseudotaxifoliae) TaxID=655384 RepID=A0A451DHD4_9GAMM|nr:16S rRNA (uracil(1498)-N(3))-methyltransferase [Buchnera aphidicola]VFP86036.1 Ribosomal RNA small subunit methyltransferase E [Buchnera aphidicola (Cinara pseudotaxifoliae)]
MYIPRIYFNKSIKINTVIKLKKNMIHFCINVIRLRIGDIIHVFNNTNYIFISKILEVKKKNILLKIVKKKIDDKESPIKIHLGQCVSKRMSVTIEKSVELGIHTITPIISKKKKSEKKTFKKIHHWKKIIISACTQSLRNIVPKLNTPTTIYQWCDSINSTSTKIIFDPKATNKISNIPNKYKNVFILIGSEKGFDEYEKKYAQEKNFLKVSLGPRILRTETASIAAITALQVHLGDI